MSQSANRLNQQLDSSNAGQTTKYIDQANARETESDNSTVQASSQSRKSVAATMEPPVVNDTDGARIPNTSQQSNRISQQEVSEVFNKQQSSKQRQDKQVDQRSEQNFIDKS